MNIENDNNQNSQKDNKEDLNTNNNNPEESKLDTSDKSKKLTIDNLDTNNSDDILEIVETPDSEPDRDYARVPEAEKADSLKLAMFCAEIAESMKAEDIKVLDVSNNTTIADYFVIMTGFNRKQIQGIAFEIEKALKKQDRKFAGIEGYDSSWWILMDYNTVIVNIFYEDARKYYELETLWADAKVVFPSVESDSNNQEKTEE